MSSATLPLYTAVQSADSANVGNALVLRDSNGDSSHRYLTATRHINSGGDYVSNTATKTTSYTATSSDRIVVCDTTSAGFTVTLPAASGVTGQLVTFINIGSANTLTLDGSGAETVNGTATVSVASSYGKATLYCNGTSWYVVG